MMKARNKVPTQPMASVPLRNSLSITNEDSAGVGVGQEVETTITAGLEDFSSKKGFRQDWNALLYSRLAL